MKGLGVDSVSTVRSSSSVTGEWASSIFSFLDEADIVKTKKEVMAEQKVCLLLLRFLE